MDIQKGKVNGSETHLNVHYLRLKKSKKNHFYKQINRQTTQLHRCEISNKHPSIPHSFQKYDIFSLIDNIDVYMTFETS